jgi:hypothetical protein
VREGKGSFGIALREQGAELAPPMTPQNYKARAIACFVIAAICLFVAFERSQANANTVNAINQFGGSPFGELKPAMPAAAKYALFFAVLAGAGGAVLLTRAKPRP